jgi:septal ring factor EnvC (AmiA/AmiB activator)
MISTSKELKKELKQLRKLKKQLKPGSKERLDLNKKIKLLKGNVADLTLQNVDKAGIITEILGLDKVMDSLDIDLTKHSVEDLQKYLNKLKKGNKK